ncbi:sarcoplasmic calcium-binding protein isoform X2 [Procambarus clarkii]|uniref:sarcoplasmic calcium-binding protein isoform X2 n=1 Tax=Procambarus clarkii TaxID=6728 RepID=UPI0037438064
METKYLTFEIHLTVILITVQPEYLDACDCEGCVENCLPPLPLSASQVGDVARRVTTLPSDSTSLVLLPGRSSFWRQKMRTHHRLLDVNKDGVVSWDDFDALITRFRELGRLTPQEVTNFTDALRHVWEEEWGASSDPYVFIGQEQFLTQMEHVVNTKELRKRVASPLIYFFKAVDTDGSGEISVEEFQMFYSGLGLSEEDAAVSFAAIDKNGDGKLSMKEFIKLGREFFLSEDDTRPSKLFWGPLSD